MIDINYFRRNLDELRESIARKKFSCDLDSLVELDRARRDAISVAETERAGQKSANAEMSQMEKGSPEFLEKVAQMKEIATKVKELETLAKESDEVFQEAFLAVPNLPHQSVPDGKDESDNETISTWGDAEGDFPHAVPHYDIPWFEKMIDFPRGVKVVGAGFPFYLGDMSKLVRALINFFLEEAGSNGYAEIHSPIVVNAASATATGQLPDKEGMMYHIETDNLYVIPTAEVPITNIFSDTKLESSDLPVKCTAYSPCFRREAGSYGKEVRGLNRLHQFDKVEIVQICHPTESYTLLKLMVEHVSELLKKLGLTFRIVRLCGGDLGFTSALTYDFEIYAPGQGKWLEVSSVSNFETYQSNRLNVKYINSDRKNLLCHTLNGSALALPRIVVGLLEENQTPDGIVMPKPLLKYLNFDKITIST